MTTGRTVMVEERGSYAVVDYMDGTDRVYIPVPRFQPRYPASADEVGEAQMEWREEVVEIALDLANQERVLTRHFDGDAG